MAPVRNMKAVEKAMALPLVNSAYSEVTRVTSPYMESTMTKVSPVVETTMSMVTGVRSQVEDKVYYYIIILKFDIIHYMNIKVLPHIPAKVTETVATVQTAAVEHVTSAVEKVDNFACGGIDQLTDKVPQLKEATPKIMEETRTSVNSYLGRLTDYAASFSVSQLALKVLDSGLDLVDDALTSLGSEEEGAVRSGVKMVHSAANTIRVTAVNKAGTEKAKKIEEASILGAFIEVSGLQDLLGLLGFRLRKIEDDEKTATIYEDEHAQAVLPGGEDAAPVVVNTAENSLLDTAREAQLMPEIQDVEEDED